MRKPASAWAGPCVCSALADFGFTPRLLKSARDGFLKSLPPATHPTQSSSGEAFDSGKGWGEPVAPEVPPLSHKLFMKAAVSVVCEEAFAEAAGYPTRESGRGKPRARQCSIGARSGRLPRPLSPLGSPLKRPRPMRNPSKKYSATMELALHHLNKSVEQIMRVMWAGRGLRVVLDREDRKGAVLQPLDCLVV